MESEEGSIAFQSQPQEALRPDRPSHPEPNDYPTGTPGDNVNLDDFTCPVCMDLFIDPAKTNCDHVFCTYCLANWFHLRGRKNCPTCRTAIERLNPESNIVIGIEDYVRLYYRPDQKIEREETKRNRNESEVMQDLGSNPLATLVTQSLNMASRFEFDFPIFEFDDDDDQPDRLDIEYTRESMINLYARAMVESSTTDHPDHQEWPTETDRITPPSNTTTRRFGYNTPAHDITARLDDFEITLRESQMAYRYLMEGLTSIDPQGTYFSTIEQRLRTLGLFPQGGRLMTSFLPYEESENTASRSYSRRHITPHASDWYFLHYNRIRLERDIHHEWVRARRQRIQAEPLRDRDREARRQTRGERDFRHMLRTERSSTTLRTESDHESYQEPAFPTYSERHRPPPRRRRHRHRSSRINLTDYHLPSTHMTPMENFFSTYDHTFYGNHYCNNHMYHAEQEQPYERYSGNPLRFSPPSRMHPENAVTTNAQNICVVHPDGTETWVDVGQGQRVERDNGFHVYPSRREEESRDRHGHRATGSTSQGLLVEVNGEDDGDELLRETSYQLEFVVHRQS